MRLMVKAHENQATCAKTKNVFFNDGFNRSHFVCKQILVNTKKRNVRFLSIWARDQCAMRSQLNIYPLLKWSIDSNKICAVCNGYG